jgi:DNA-binding Lrp family transcriptional regulator
VADTGMDALDARLLLLLADEPRLGVLECARRLGVARGTVQARLDRLAGSGVLRGFPPEVDLAAIGYARGVGPGVWDIHSPRVPPQQEIEAALRLAVAAVPASRLWVNPDCGLKTRGYPEVEASLRHLTAAAAAVRG